MNKDELGSVNRPEQYARVDDECILSDSLTARDFFKDFYSQDGIAFLAILHLASTKVSFLPVWVYFDPKIEKIVAAAPVFKIDSLPEISHLPISKAQMLDDETLFYWKDHLYSSAYTSTGETVVRRIRCLLSVRDMISVAEMDTTKEIDDVYPVKLYAIEDGRFLAACWAIEANENCCWFETICADDEKYIDNVDVHKTFFYPININERVILGDDIYLCRYTDEFGIFMDKTSFKATEADRTREALPPPAGKKHVEPEPPRPKLKIIFNKDEAEKKEASSGGKGRIIALTPRK